MKLLSIRIPPEAIAKVLEAKMNSTLLRRITNRSTHNSTSDLPSNSTSDLPSDSTASRESTPPSTPPQRRQRKRQSNSKRERLREIFPPGLELKSNLKSIGQPYTYNPQQLNDIMEHYRDCGDPRAEKTVVASAWYGKQTKGAKHEFIVIHVEDLTGSNFKNCIAIDRNQGLPASNASVASSPLASDAFRVSYDGDLDRLLQGSQLAPYLMLEDISFKSGKPLLLQNLVALVHHISKEHTRYNPVDTNCYWFSGLIWECIRQMYPAAEYKPIIQGKKGRIGYARFIPNPIQVQNVLRAVQKGIGESDPGGPSPDYSTNLAEEDMGTTAGDDSRN